MSKRKTRKIIIYIFLLCFIAYGGVTSIFNIRDPLLEWIVMQIFKRSAGERIISGYVTYNNKLKILAPKGSVVKRKDDTLSIYLGMAPYYAGSSIDIQPLDKDARSKIEKLDSEKINLTIAGKRVEVIQLLPPMRRDDFEVCCSSTFEVFCYPEAMDLEIHGFFIHGLENKDEFLDWLKTIKWIQKE